MIGSELLNFRILEQLGEGGMGVVYKGIDTTLDRLVAVKVLSSDLSRNPDLVERFRTEAKAQANLNHTNIATLYAFVAQAGQAWMVMEYIEGETISQMIERRGLLPPDVAVPLFKQALLGIGWAHRMGIVHRDMKPANLMVNKQGIVKVMDFGIAKVLGSNRGLTRTGTALGTASYMSPEQVMNQAIDIRSDIYSLGVTLYEMLTANLPFAGESDFQIMTAHVNAPPMPPTRHYPYIPRGIENAVLKAMLKDPVARFQTVEEFGAALDHPEDFGITWGSMAPTPVPVQPPATPPPQAMPPPPVMPPATPPQAALTNRPFNTPGGGQASVDLNASTSGLAAFSQPIPSQPMSSTNMGTPVPPVFGHSGNTGVITPPPLPPPPMTPVPPSGGLVGKLIAVFAVLAVLGGGAYVYKEKKRKEELAKKFQNPHPDPGPNQNKQETREVSVWPPKPDGDTPKGLKIVEFDADSKRLQPGQTARLRWSVEGASRITITPDVGDVDPTGSKEIAVQRTTQFQLKATKLSGEEVHQTITVEVGTGQVPARQLEITFEAQPDSITLGQTARVQWAVPAAAEIVISPGIGRVPPAGSRDVRPTETTTYRLQARAGTLVGTKDVTVQVQQPKRQSVKPEITSFQATPTSIPLGSSATLSWNVQNATAASITPHPGALKNSSGSIAVTPATTTTYTLTAQSKDGLTDSASTTVRVTAGPGPIRTSTSMITVVHDHGGALNQTSWPSCYGALQVTNGVLRYSVAGSVDGRNDQFEIPIAQVQDVTMNPAPIKSQPAFHIVVRGQHLNFVATGMTAVQAVAELKATLPRR